MKLADLLIREDRANHVIDGAAIYLIVAGVLKFFNVYGHREIALSVAIVVGVLKEVWDGHQEKKARAVGLTPMHSADPFDAASTFAGALAMYVAGEL